MRPTRDVVWMNSAVESGRPSITMTLSRSMSTPWESIDDAATRSVGQ